MLGVGLLPDREDDHPTLEVVLGALELERQPSAVGARLAELRRPTAQGKRLTVDDDLDRLGVVDELDLLGDRTVELVLAGGNLVWAAPVDDLDVLTPGQPLGDPAGIHRNVPGADDDHPRRELGPRPVVDRAEEFDAVDDSGVIDLSRKRLAPTRHRSSVGRHRAAP